MAGKPLKIPWEKIMVGQDDPAPEVEVVGATAGAARGGGGECPHGEAASLSDYQLEEKIERVKKSIDSLATNLPDNGAKLRSNLRNLQEEAERRKNPLRTGGKKDLEEREEGTCSGIRVCSDWLKKISSSSASSQSHTQSSFSSHFSRLLEGKTDSGNRAAFSEELRSIRKDSTLPLEKSLHSHLPKRKSPQNQALQDLKSKQVQDVVLLDEEDVVPVQQIEEDVVPIQQIQEEDEPGKWKEAKMYYPSRVHPECVELCYLDIKCLDPNSYLSSTIMNFYIQYLQKPVSPSGMPRGEYHFFNTYFYRKLEEALPFKGGNNGRFTKLRRWWKGVNIFEKAYIFIPIHGALHWSLVIICIPAKEEESGPIILHLDSLGLHTSNSIFENIESYLKEEWKYVNDDAHSQNLPISKRIWNNLPRRIERKKIPVPQQKNEYDCGLFVLYFMERFIEKAPDRLRKKDLAMFGSKWFHPEEASALRKRLQELLLEEFHSARLKNDGAESPASPSSSSED